MWAPTGSAATIPPTTTADDAKTNGNRTLREAVEAANTARARDAGSAGAVAARNAGHAVVLTARVTAAGRAVAGRCDLQQKTSRGCKRRATSRTTTNGACVLHIRFAVAGPKTLRIRFVPTSRRYAPSLSRVTVVRGRV